MACWKPDTLRRRFMDRVEFEPNTGCWLWSGQEREGYGRVCNGGRWTGAHRFSYQLHCGDIPDGAVVRHRCDTPACVNPDHLLVGTQLENIADRQARGRNGRTMGRRGAAHPMSKLTAEDVDVIRTELAHGTSRVALAKRFGVGAQAIGKIARGERWPAWGGRIGPLNPSRKRVGDTQAADYWGIITLPDGSTLQLGAWIRDGANGEFLSLKVSSPQPSRAEPDA